MHLPLNTRHFSLQKKILLFLDRRRPPQPCLVLSTLVLLWSDSSPSWFRAQPRWIEAVTEICLEGSGFGGCTWSTSIRFRPFCTAHLCQCAVNLLDLQLRHNEEGFSDGSRSLPHSSDYLGFLAHMIISFYKTNRLRFWRNAVFLPWQYVKYVSSAI